MLDFKQKEIDSLCTYKFTVDTEPNMKAFK